MATAAAPRSYVYLSLLAGRAITALADLAEEPKVWNDQIRKGLADGVEYCRAIGEAPDQRACSRPQTGITALPQTSGNSRRQGVISGVRGF